MASLESFASRLALTGALVTGGCNYQATQPRVDDQSSEPRAEAPASQETDRAHTLCYECRDRVLGLDGDIAAMLEGIAKAATCIDELNKDPKRVECSLTDNLTVPSSMVTECAKQANVDESAKCLSPEISKADPHGVEDRFLAKAHVCEKSGDKVLSYLKNTCVPEVKSKKTLLEQLRVVFDKLSGHYVQQRAAARLRNESSEKVRVDAEQQARKEAERKAAEEGAKKKQTLDEVEDALKEE